MNWSYGRFALKASITQSRQRHMVAAGVVVEAVGVGVAGDVEPVDGHALAVAG